MSDEVYVVIAERGEYEDSHQWICGVFASRGDAETMAAEHKRIARIQNNAYNDWCKLRAPHYWHIMRIRAGVGVLTDAEDTEIEKAVGPCPKGGEAADFYVVPVPLEVWGRYDLWSEYPVTDKDNAK